MTMRIKPQENNGGSGRDQELESLRILRAAVLSLDHPLQEGFPVREAAVAHFPYESLAAQCYSGHISFWEVL